MLVKRTFVGVLRLLASAAHAQTSRRTTTGTVLDGSGARLSALCPHATRSAAACGRHQPGRNPGRYVPPVMVSIRPAIVGAAERDGRRFEWGLVFANNREEACRGQTCL